MRRTTALLTVWVGSAILLILALAVSPAPAAELPESMPEAVASESDTDEDAAELSRLLRIPDKHTEIATHSNLNSGVINIIQHLSKGATQWRKKSSF